MLLQTPVPTPTPLFQHPANDIFESLGSAVIEYWYILLAMLVMGIALAWLNGVADRFTRRHGKR